MCVKGETMLRDGKLRKVYCGCTMLWREGVQAQLFNFVTFSAPICPTCNFYPWYLTKKVKVKPCSK